MIGRWKVELIGGGDYRQETRLIDTVNGVSGVDVGNRMEVYLPASFAGTDDVTIQISGTILQIPREFSTTLRHYVIDGWNIDRSATNTISRADFNKANTFKVVQATAKIGFQLSTTKSDSDSSTKVNSQTGGVEVGVEDSVSVGGTVGVATGTETVKVSAKGTFSATTSDQSVSQITNGTVEQVTFDGRMVAPSSPLITPVI